MVRTESTHGMGERKSESPREANVRWAWQQLKASLEDLRFGTVTLIVQDGVVVQVERVERHRYRRDPAERVTGEQQE